MKQTIRPTYISCVSQEDGSIDIVVPASMAAEFKEMVRKGTNLSPNMHVEVRDFADRILGRQSFVGSCMKQELYGYPTYVRPLQEKEEATEIISKHWDIPSEDKYELATENPICVCGASKSQHPYMRCASFVAKKD